MIIVKHGGGKHWRGRACIVITIVPAQHRHGHQRRQPAGASFATRNDLKDDVINQPNLVMGRLSQNHRWSKGAWNKSVTVLNSDLACGALAATNITWRTSPFRWYFRRSLIVLSYVAHMDASEDLPPLRPQANTANWWSAIANNASAWAGYRLMPRTSLANSTTFFMTHRLRPIAEGPGRRRGANPCWSSITARYSRSSCRRRKCSKCAFQVALADHLP